MSSLAFRMRQLRNWAFLSNETPKIFDVSDVQRTDTRHSPDWLKKKIESLRNDGGTVSSLLYMTSEKEHLLSDTECVAVMEAERDRSWIKLARLMNEVKRGETLADYVNYWIEEHPALGYRLNLAQIINRVDRLPDGIKGIMPVSNMVMFISHAGRQVSKGRLHLNYTSDRQTIVMPASYAPTRSYLTILSLDRALKATFG